MKNKESEKDAAGVIFMSCKARELCEKLGYKRWENFSDVIDKAMDVCRDEGQDDAYHFRPAAKMVSIGSGSLRKVKDYVLTPYALYLILQCACHEKDSVQEAWKQFGGLTSGEGCRGNWQDRDIQRYPKEVFVRISDGGYQKVNIVDIEHIVAMDDYCMIYTKEFHVLHTGPMTEFEEILDPALFMKTHRSHIVKLECLYRIYTPYVLMESGAKVDVTSDNLKKLKSRLYFLEGKKKRSSRAKRGL